MIKRYVAIILAAGLSRRFGSPKLLYQIEGTSLIERVVQTFVSSNCIDKIVVVLGHERERLENILKGYPVHTVYNPYYLLGMSSSLKISLSHVNDYDEVFLHLGDKPFIRPEIISEMIEASKEKNPHIVVPTYNGKKGHPVLIGPGWYLKEKACYVEGDYGLRFVIERETENVIYLSADETVLIDIDTEEDLNRITNGGKE
ncbi:MAG: nucleotidyltransferase family protein [Deltaproteobacteria bacterium]|nr:nucleotidyltransferase family protein [Deltaproteobacteria bacterium]